MAFPPTDWLDWTTAEYDVGAPATSLSFERWFRNPVALAQGAPGAPRVQGMALGGVYMGSLSLAGASAGGFTGLDGFGLCRADFSVVGAGGNLQVGYSSDNGATYGAYQDIASLTAGFATESGTSGSFCINLQTGVYSATGLTSSDSSAEAFKLISSGGTHTVPAGCNAFQIRSSVGSFGGAYIFYSLGGLE